MPGAASQILGKMAQSARPRLAITFAPCIDASSILTAARTDVASITCNSGAYLMRSASDGSTRGRQDEAGRRSLATTPPCRRSITRAGSGPAAPAPAANAPMPAPVPGAARADRSAARACRCATGAGGYCRSGTATGSSPVGVGTLVRSAALSGYGLTPTVLRSENSARISADEGLCAGLSR